jgi:hypothetical protein
VPLHGRSTYKIGLEKGKNARKRRQVTQKARFSTHLIRDNMLSKADPKGRQLQWTLLRRFGDPNYRAHHCALESGKSRCAILVSPIRLLTQGTPFALMLAPADFFAVNSE